jgi:alginate O-acetyltransferase complex protein AlgF
MHVIKQVGAKGQSANSFDRRRLIQTLLATNFVAFACVGVSQAQPAGQLYDPEPPLDSAYVRVVVLNQDSASEITVDGRVRVAKLNASDVSDYLVLPAGKRAIVVKALDKMGSKLIYNLDVTAGKALTLAFTAGGGDTAPKLFEDKANTNKLKSLVAAYNLDPKAGAITVSTADGATKVFSNLAFGTSNSIQVNPVAIELIAAKAGVASVAGSKFGLTMTAGANYSVFLIPNAQGNLTARAIQNKTERYVTK